MLTRDVDICTATVEKTIYQCVYDINILCMNLNYVWRTNSDTCCICMLICIYIYICPYTCVCVCMQSIGSLKISLGSKQVVTAHVGLQHPSPPAPLPRWRWPSARAAPDPRDRMPSRDSSGSSLSLGSSPGRFQPHNLHVSWISHCSILIHAPRES